MAVGPGNFYAKIISPTLARTYTRSNFVKTPCNRSPLCYNGSMKNFEVVLNIRLLFPEAQIELDNDGQVIIYTGEYK